MFISALRKFLGNLITYFHIVNPSPRSQRCIFIFVAATALFVLTLYFGGDDFFITTVQAADSNTIIGNSKTPDKPSPSLDPNWFYFLNLTKTVFNTLINFLHYQFSNGTLKGPSLTVEVFIPLTPAPYQPFHMPVLLRYCLNGLLMLLYGLRFLVVFTLCLILAFWACYTDTFVRFQLTKASKPMWEVFYFWGRWSCNDAFYKELLDLYTEFLAVAWFLCILFVILYLLDLVLSRYFPEFRDIDDSKK